MKTWILDKQLIHLYTIIQYRRPIIIYRLGGEGGGGVGGCFGGEHSILGGTEGDQS